MSLHVNDIGLLTHLFLNNLPCLFRDISVNFIGAESEPFIVMLPGGKLQQLIVSVNNRYLTEKDLNGEIVEKLDLKSIKSFVISMETVGQGNILEGFSLPVCEIKFDYLRKDRRVRKYVMENSDRAQVFL